MPLHRQLMKKSFLLVTVALCSQSVSTGQTTQGLISGRITDAYTGAPVAGAVISFQSAATAGNGSSKTDASGYYTLPLLSPGLYRIRAADARYQAQEMHELEVPVAIGFGEVAGALARTLGSEDIAAGTERVRIGGIGAFSVDRSPSCRPRRTPPCRCCSPASTVEPPWPG